MRWFPLIAWLTVVAPGASALGGKPEPEPTPAEIDAGMQRQADAWRANGTVLNPDGKIQRVLYPMGLADVGSAFMTFASPKGMPTDVMIIEGGGEFGTPDEIAERYAEPGAKQAHFKYLAKGDYLHNGLPGRDRIYGARVKWELERIGAQDIRIAYDEAEKAHPTVRVTFRLAGKERRVTVVREWIGVEAPSRALAAFLRQGYDALLEKASGPSLTSEPELIPFLRSALAHLDRSHGVVVSDDPKWVEVANLGLLPLRHDGDLPARLGYATVREQDTNPILRPSPRTLRDGVAYLRGLIAKGDKASLERLASLQKAGFFMGRDTILLEHFAAVARSHRLRWSPSDLSRPLMERLRHESDAETVDAILHPTGTIVGFYPQGDRIEAIATSSPAAEQAESLRWKEHVRSLLDSRLRNLYERRRPLWREVRQAADRGDARGYLRLALAQFDSQRPATAEALARDIVHVGLTNFWQIAQQLRQQLGETRFAELWASLEQPGSVRPVLERMLTGD